MIGRRVALAARKRAGKLILSSSTNHKGRLMGSTSEGDEGDWGMLLVWGAVASIVFS
jgi:hypothetical protein